jgi:hypothetical protein
MRFTFNVKQFHLSTNVAPDTPTAQYALSRVATLGGSTIDERSRGTGQRRDCWSSYFLKPLHELSKLDLPMTVKTVAFKGAKK